MKPNTRFSAASRHQLTTDGDDDRFMVNHRHEVENVKDFVEDLFRPNDVKTKLIDGKDLTDRDFVAFAELYVSELRSGRLSKPEKVCCCCQIDPAFHGMRSSGSQTEP